MLSVSMPLCPRHDPVAVGLWSGTAFPTIIAITVATPSPPSVMCAPLTVPAPWVLVKSPVCLLPSCPLSCPPSPAPLELGGALSREELGSHAQTLTWQVNDVPFRNLTREEAVQVLLGLPLGEEVELVTQRKQDSEWGGPRPGKGRVRAAAPRLRASACPQSSAKWCSPAWATPSTSARTSS